MSSPHCAALAEVFARRSDVPARKNNLFFPSSTLYRRILEGNRVMQDTQSCNRRPTKPHWRRHPAKARPTAPKEAGAPAPVSARRGESATLIQTAKVMIVDDEPVNVKVVQKHLKLAGYQHFVTSTDPRPVMEMIAQEMPDVILIDVMMPFVSGLQILEKLHDDEQLAHIPTIVLTASDNEQTKMEALELGAADFLEQAREHRRVDRPRAQRIARQGTPRSPEELRPRSGAAGPSPHRGTGRLAAGTDPLPGQDGGVPR